jgi:hypothetical protein
MKVPTSVEVVISKVYKWVKSVALWSPQKEKDYNESRYNKQVIARS